jgi:hypothetical protein
MTKVFHPVPWTIAMLSMAALCFFSAMRAPSFVAPAVPVGDVR